MSFETKNRKLFYNEKRIITNLPKGIAQEDKYPNTEKEIFLKFSKKTQFATAFWSGIQLHKLKRFTVLYRPQLYWFRPWFGSSEAEIPSHSIILWYERTDGLIVTLIPIIDKGYNFYLNGKKEGLEVMADNNCECGKIKSLTGLYIRVGQNLYEMLEKASKSISEFINVGKLREEKKVPEWAEYLGYCTWNTFYRKVNQEKLIRMLHTIVNEKRVNLGFVILDDGWQKTRFRKLLDKGVNRKKFPDGLDKTIQLVKNKFNVPNFLVWHTLQGYWFNIAIHFSPYGKKFDLTKNLAKYGPSYPKSNYKLKLEWGLNKLMHIFRFHFGVLYPEQMKNLWNNYHGWLASQGVDGVKVDNQAGTEVQTFNMGYQANMMRKYHHVLEESVSQHFSPYSIINCMSQNTNIYYQLEKSNITRNSDDYFPEKEMAQCQHIIYNAYNNIWCEKFALPDWDMFQTDHPWGEYQAAARSISGSPIYFADDYQKVNEKLIKKIALPNGRILRCPKPALLARENLFNNPAKPGRALKITNENRTNSVVGIFNVMVKSETNTLFSLDLIEKYRKNDYNESEKKADKQFAVYQYKEKELFTLTLMESKEISLGIKGFELFTVAEIENRFAPIGILTMFNSGGIFRGLNRKGDTIEIELLYGGEIGFYSEQAPTRVTMNGNEKLKFEYYEDSKLLKIFVNESVNPHITIFF